MRRPFRFGSALFLALVCFYFAGNPYVLGEGALSSAEIGQVRGKSTPPEPSRGGPLPPRAILGFAYGPFRDGQSPGKAYPSPQQIADDMAVLKGIAQGVRTYSSGRELWRIVEFAEQEGLRAAPGAWVDANRSVSDEELSALYDAVDRFKNIDFVIVGNEALYSGRLTEFELIDYIHEVKARTNLPVTTGEPWRLWHSHPDLVRECDLLLVHIYPYLEGVPIEKAAQKVVEAVRMVEERYPNKRVVIGETGWPTEGRTIGKAVPSVENQERFAREVVSLCRKKKIDLFYFEAFDEAWKSGEGDHGPHWGLYDSKRQPKHGFTSLLQ